MKADEAYILAKNGSSGGSSAVSSVNTKTGAVVLSKSDIGLSSVVDKDTTNASNITSGTLDDARLSTNVTKAGNTFNGITQLVKTDASGKIPVANIPVGLVNIVTVADQTARLALAQGTILTLALQADTKIEWAINANKDPSISGNWVNCGSYASTVTSVNNATGAITIDIAGLNGIPSSYLDTDISLTTNSDTKIPSQKAVKSYVDTKTGGTVDYLYATATSAVSGGQVPLTLKKGNMTLTSSNITLKANKTYDLYASLSVRCTYCCFGWMDVATNTSLPNSSFGNSASANSSDSMVTTPAFATITPSADMQVKLVITADNGYSTMNTDSCFVKIQQIGTSGTTNVPWTMVTGIPEWTPYVPTITCPTTTFQLVNSYTMKGLYKVVGKSLLIKFVYTHAVNTGYNEGNGSNLPYQISIPNGFAIDTTKANIPSTLTSGASGAGKDALPLGNGIYFSSTFPFYSPCKIVPLSSNALGVYLVMNGTTVVNTLWGCAQSYYGGASVGLEFEANIPIL